MPDITGMQARLRDAGSLPSILGAGFDAFEVIRLFARAYEDQVPGLLAAFMTTADTAVDGRDCLMFAPSLPDARTDAAPAAPAPAGAGVEEVTDALAALGALLHERLTHAASLATASAARSACEQAAQAAERIRHLMAREDHDGNLW